MQSVRRVTDLTDLAITAKVRRAVVIVRREFLVATGDGHGCDSATPSTSMLYEERLRAAFAAQACCSVGTADLERAISETSAPFLSTQPSRSVAHHRGARSGVKPAPPIPRWARDRKAR